VFRIRDIPPEVDEWIRENYPQYRDLASLPEHVLNELERKFQLPNYNTSFVPPSDRAQGESNSKPIQGGAPPTWNETSSELGIIITACAVSAIGFTLFGVYMIKQRKAWKSGRFQDVNWDDISRDSVNSSVAPTVITNKDAVAASAITVTVGAGSMTGSIPSSPRSAIVSAANRSSIVSLNQMPLPLYSNFMEGIEEEAPLETVELSVPNSPMPSQTDE
jgi:hypothetical protein